MSVYNPDDLTGAVIYYLTKHDILNIEFSRIDKVRKNFIKKANNKASFTYFEKIDVIKFCDNHPHIIFNNTFERVIVSEDYDYAVMKDCKKFTKKFRTLNEWQILKEAIREEFRIK